MENMAIAKIIRNDGNEAPRVQTMAPGVFANLYPSRELMLMARAPGQIWVVAMASKNSSFVIQ